MRTCPLRRTLRGVVVSTGASLSAVAAEETNTALQQLCQTLKYESSDLVPNASEYAQTNMSIINILGLSEHDNNVELSFDFRLE